MSQSETAPDGMINLLTLELERGAQLTAAIAPEVALLAECRELLIRVFAGMETENVTADAVVTMALLSRVHSDLRGMHLMLMHGYTQQAGALAAAAADAAFAIATVAGKSPAGKKWLLHQNQWRTLELTRDGIVALASVDTSNPAIDRHRKTGHHAGALRLVIGIR